MKKKPSVSDLVREVAGLRVQLRGHRKRIEELEEWIAEEEEAALEFEESNTKQPSFNIEIDAGGNGCFIGMN